MILSSKNDYALAPPNPPEGYRIRRSRPDEVFVDIDSIQGRWDWDKNRGILEQLGAEEWKLEGSKSPGHFHGIVTLSQNLGRVERLLIGVCLGGDKKRALLGLKSILEGYPERADLFLRGESRKVMNPVEWKKENPSSRDVINTLIADLRTPARWQKAILHLRERGLLEDSPRDIGPLLKEVVVDIEKEERSTIEERLWSFAWSHIRRGVTHGLPEWYKEELLKKQFEHAENQDNLS